MTDHDTTASDKTGKRRNTQLLLAILAAMLLAGAGIFIFSEPTPTPTDLAALPRNPADPALQVLQKARALDRAGRKAESLATLESYVAAHDGDVVVRPTLAKFYLNMGQVEKGEREVDALLRRMPDSPDMLWAKGVIRENAKAGTGAVYFEKAVALPNASAKIFTEYGLLQARKNRFVVARDYLGRAVEAGTTDGRVYFALGKIALNENRFEDALRQVQRGTELMPNEPVGWMLLAEVQKNLTKFADAHTSLDKAIAIAEDPKFGFPPTLKANVLLRLGELYQAQQKWKFAGDTFAQAALTPQTRATGSLRAAQSYYRAEKRNLAMEYITIAHDTSPTEPEVRAWLRKLADAYAPKKPPATKPPGSFLDAIPRTPDSSNSAGDAFPKPNLKVKAPPATPEPTPIRF